eukprot:549449_1
MCSDLDTPTTHSDNKNKHTHSPSLITKSDNSIDLRREHFNLRFCSKAMQRIIKKLQKEDKIYLRKATSAIKCGNLDIAKIYIENLVSVQLQQFKINKLCSILQAIVDNILLIKTEEEWMQFKDHSILPFVAQLNMTKCFDIKKSIESYILNGQNITMTSNDTKKCLKIYQSNGCMLLIRGYIRIVDIHLYKHKIPVDICNLIILFNPTRKYMSMNEMVQLLFDQMLTQYMETVSISVSEQKRMRQQIHNDCVCAHSYCTCGNYKLRKLQGI